MSNQPETCHVEAVLLDAVGTLLYADPPVAVAYAEAGRRFGSRLQPEEIATRFHAAFARQEQVDNAAGGGGIDEPRERRRWLAVVADVFDDVVDLPALFEALWLHFAAAEHWALYPDVPGALGQLRQRGLKLCLASNFDARLHAICGGHPPLAAMDRVFISSELGFRKPHPAFFRGVAAELAAPPQRLLLVGDEVDSDYEGARAAGWRALLLDRQGASPGQPGRIRSLAELPPRLRGAAG